MNDEYIVRDIHDRLDDIHRKVDKIEERTDKIEKRISWFAGFFTAIGAAVSLTSQKIYTILFG